MFIFNQVINLENTHSINFIVNSILFLSVTQYAHLIFFSSYS